MDKKIVAWVEVRCLDGDFVSIDFGDFAITIFKEIGSPRIVISKGINYEEDYWGFLCGLDGLPCTLESRELDPRAFNRLEHIAYESYCPTQKQFRDLMVKLFPESLDVLVN